MSTNKKAAQKNVVQNKNQEDQKENKIPNRDCPTEPKNPSKTDTIEETSLEEVQTVENYIKHPLEDTWTLWYFQNDKTLDWKENQLKIATIGYIEDFWCLYDHIKMASDLKQAYKYVVVVMYCNLHLKTIRDCTHRNTKKTKDWKGNQLKIATIGYIEDFWCLYDHIKMASDLKQGTDYSLFKTGISPMWEDPVNKNGGRWIISLAKGQRQDLDRCWLDILLLLIGATLQHGDQVCGAVVNIRFKGDKIGVWTKDYTKSTAIMEIGRQIKEALKISYSNTLKYEAHIDSMDKKNNSARYTV